MCDAISKITRSHGCVTGKSQGKSMIDLTPVILIILLGVTAVAAYQYYRHIKRANKEYEKARDFVEDIVLSFDRELKRESDKFDSMTSKVDGSYTTADVSFRKAEELEKKVEPIIHQLGVLNQSYQAISQTITQSLAELKNNTQSNTSALSELANLDTRLKDIEITQEDLKTKMNSFEIQIQKLSLEPQPQVTTKMVLPPMPIKRDKALAALTETEISVLEMLSKEGPKTAPDIKERVHLSREHTARLMKKLYEEGYVERETGKIPFRYSIKKEMEELLQKSESPQSV
jgi:chromosome segregation ATPase